MNHDLLQAEIVGAVFVSWASLLVGRKNPKVADAAKEFADSVAAATEKAKK